MGNGITGSLDLKSVAGSLVIGLIALCVMEKLGWRKCMKEEHQNKVELLGHYGGDLTHAQSAWTSTVRDIDEAKMNRMPALLKMLAENHHETPFEKSSLHFLVTTEVASHIHIIKHRIGVSVNGESARYKELKDDKYYVPPVS